MAQAFVALSAEFVRPTQRLRARGREPLSRFRGRRPLRRAGAPVCASPRSASAAALGSGNASTEPLLWAEHLRKSYDGERVQLDDASLILHRGERIGVVGANGAGKSTLLRILAGEEYADDGERMLKRNVRLVYVAQTPQLPPEKSVLDSVFAADTPLNRTLHDYSEAIRRLRAVAAEAADDGGGGGGGGGGGARTSAATAALQHAQTQMDAMQAWEADSHAHRVLDRLSLSHLLSTRVGDLSGGQQKRVALAAALVQRPDVLLLDEPTNHLDVDAIEWLERVLRDGDDPAASAEPAAALSSSSASSPAFSGASGKSRAEAARLPVALLLVTHDRYFLDRCCARIVELDEGRLYNHAAGGGYAAFLEERAARLEEVGRMAKVATAQLKKEAEWMRRQPKARAGKSRARIDRFHSLQGELQQHKRATRALGADGGTTVELSTSESRLGSTVVEVKDGSLRMGGQLLLDGFSYDFKRGDRIGIVGDNGVGKSTLLRVLLQQQTLDRGEVVVGDTVVFGYYEQAGVQLPEHVRLYDYVQEVLSNYGSKMTAATALKRYGFEGAQSALSVGRLSGGERRRLQLLQIMAREPNVLVLDEVTNDLDLATLTLLENFLLEYSGVLLVVSHDRFFMDRIVNHLFVLKGDGVVKEFVGNFSEYLDYRRELKLAEEEAEVKRQKEARRREDAAAGGGGGGGDGGGRSKPARLSYKEKKELSALEREIDKLSAKQDTLNSQLSTVTDDYVLLTEWTEQLAELTAVIDSKTERWMALSERNEG